MEGQAKPQACIWKFAADGYPKHARSDAWRDALGRLSLKLIEELEEIRHGQIHMCLSNRGFMFARIVSCPQEYSFKRNAVGSAVFLVLHLEGGAQLVDGDRTTRIGQGEILFWPTDAPARLSFDTDFRQLLVKIPVEVIGTRMVTPILPKIGCVARDSAIGHVFSEMLNTIAKTIEHVDAHDMLPLEVALSELLISCLIEGAWQNTLVGATAVQTSNLQRLCLYIDTRLSDPNLTITQVAQEQAVSPRYLQKLFEAAGTNFGRHLRQRRLERCRSDLMNSLYEKLSITDVCFRWGFNDAAHFSRTFREKFGVSPRSYRHEAVPEGPSVHLSRGWPDVDLKVFKSASIGPLATKTRPARLLSFPHQIDLAGRDNMFRLGGAASPATVQTKHHYISATEKTVHWGYFSRRLRPIAEVETGDIVTIETLTHHAYDDYERMIKGDRGAESIFHWTRDRKSVVRRGAGPMDASIYGRGAGEGFGFHICTGPIKVRYAEPGDVLELRILDTRLRPCANAMYPGKSFGSNAATWWGYHYGEVLTDPRPREVITIYEIERMTGGHSARAIFNFRWTPQTDPAGVVHSTIDYPGVPVDHSTVVENHGILANVRIPVRPHFGVIALAPKEMDVVDSIPPAYFGGNIDDWRAGKGSKLYLPVSVPGALLSIGDPHASQGDAEICGTAIECSLTGDFQLVLHKRSTLKDTSLTDLDYPLLETQEEWVIHGFSHANYLTELGEAAQIDVYKNSSLDPAMRDAFRKTRRFLMTVHGLSEDEAISLMSVAVDFGITQVVNGNWGVHAIVRKTLFLEAKS